MRWTILLSLKILPNQSSDTRMLTCYVYERSLQMLDSLLVKGIFVNPTKRPEPHNEPSN